MKATLRLVACAVLLVASFFLLPCTAGCGAEVQPPAQPARDGGAPDPLPRLQAMPGQEWWWQNPREQRFLEDYVEFLWGPLSWRPRTYPKSYEPMWDRQLQAKCLFLLTVDAGWRCLPALPQLDQPMLTLDGFFAKVDRTCGSYANWHFALPPNDDHRYLVLYDIDAAAYRVYEAILEEGPVIVSEFVPPARGCSPARADLAYFKRGKEVHPYAFEPLP